MSKRVTIGELDSDECRLMLAVALQGGVDIDNDDAVLGFAAGLEARTVANLVSSEEMSNSDANVLYPDAVLVTFKLLKRARARMLGN